MFANWLIRGLCLCSMVGLIDPSQEAFGEDSILRFPGEHWESCAPPEVKLDAEKIDAFVDRVGGDGCLVRDGLLVKSWGRFDAKGDWASAAKPVLSTLLCLAVEEGRLVNLDARLRDRGWRLRPKDATMTFRHLANMVSGYGRGEAPGTAWAYNDFAIQLYAKALEELFQQPLDRAFRDRLEPLQFEDGEFFGSRNGLGVNASPRDFARLGWFWLHRGRWKDQQLISHALIDQFLQPGVPSQLPRTTNPGEDYLKVGSYGGGSDQTPHGPGVYGFNLWFNETTSTGQRLWPSLPADTFQANGMWNRDTLTVIPSWKMVIAARGTSAGSFEPGAVEGEYHASLSLLAQAVALGATWPTSK